MSADAEPLATVDVLRARVADLEATLERARIVAENWRAAFLEEGLGMVRVGAHACVLILDALGGETDPERLGVVGPDAERIRSLAPPVKGA